MMIGMSVGTIYNVINAYFIGLLHNTSMLTAITLGLPIFTVLMAFGNVLGVGGGTFITPLGGAKRDGKREKGCWIYFLREYCSGASYRAHRLVSY